MEVDKTVPAELTLGCDLMPSWDLERLTEKTGCLTKSCMYTIYGDTGYKLLCNMSYEKIGTSKFVDETSQYLSWLVHIVLIC